MLSKKKVSILFFVLFSSTFSFYLMWNRASSWTCYSVGAAASIVVVMRSGKNNEESRAGAPTVDGRLANQCNIIFWIPEITSERKREVKMMIRDRIRFAFDRIIIQFPTSAATDSPQGWT